MYIHGKQKDHVSYEGGAGHRDFMMYRHCQSECRYSSQFSQSSQRPGGLKLEKENSIGRSPSPNLSACLSPAKIGDSGLLRARVLSHLHLEMARVGCRYVTSIALSLHSVTPFGSVSADALPDACCQTSSLCNGPTCVILISKVVLSEYTCPTLSLLLASFFTFCKVKPQATFTQFCHLTFSCCSFILRPGLSHMHQPPLDCSVSELNSFPNPW